MKGGRTSSWIKESLSVGALLYNSAFSTLSGTPEDDATTPWHSGNLNKEG